MTTEEIREIVRMTLEELIRDRLINVDSYDTVLEHVAPKLRAYFNGDDDSKVSAALKSIADDYYADIIYLQYRDDHTIEWIAEELNREPRTILRNKKRLIYKLYEEMKRWTEKYLKVEL